MVSTEMLKSFSYLASGPYLYLEKTSGVFTKVVLREKSIVPERDPEHLKLNS